MAGIVVFITIATYKSIQAIKQAFKYLCVIMSTVPLMLAYIICPVMCANLLTVYIIFHNNVRQIKITGCNFWRENKRMEFQSNQLLRICKHKLPWKFHFLYWKSLSSRIRGEIGEFVSKRGRCTFCERNRKCRIGWRISQCYFHNSL